MWKIKRPANEDVESELAETSEAKPLADAAELLHPHISEREENLLRLRMAIHQSLLDKINLSMLDKLPEEQIKAEITAILPELLTNFNHPLNRDDRTNLVTEVMDELLGLGPLEPLLKEGALLIHDAEFGMGAYPVG